MQSSYSSILHLRTGSNLNWYSTEPIERVLCYANQDCNPQYLSSTSQETVHISIPQPSMMQSSYSPLLTLRTCSNLTQRLSHRTRAVPIQIAPPQHFSSTSQETHVTSHISTPQPSVMQSSYSCLLPL